MHKGERIQERSQTTERRQSKVWSADECEILKTFFLTPRTGNYTESLRITLPDKTAKQIRDKVALLRREGLIPLGEQPRLTERLSSMDDYILDTEPDFSFPSTSREGIWRNREQETAEWIESLRESWLDKEHIHPLATKLAAAWSANEVLEGSFLDELIDEIAETITASTDSRKESRRKHHGERRRNKTNKKRKRYATTQELFKSCPSRLGELVRRNQLGALTDTESADPPKVKILESYRKLWEAEGLHYRTPSNEDGNKLFNPITSGDIRNRIKKLKPRGAPGLDGIRKEDLRAIAGINDLLAGLSNALLASNWFPTAWKKNSTTMIPKEGKDLNDVGGWRPITIGSLLSRIFSGVLDSKLRSVVKLSKRQKGFVEGHGCFVNARILHDIVKRGKRTSLHAAILDISKAFDCVPHGVILDALRDQGIHGRLIEFVQNMYSGVSTTMKNCGGTILQLKRGVKQGDPLSALLFNLVIDPLLENILAMEGSFEVSGESCSVLAFADDLVLLFKTNDGLQAALDIVHGHLNGIGLTLSAEKCGVFGVKKLGKSWKKLEVNVRVGDQDLRNYGADEQLNYLGVSFTVAEGVCCEKFLEEIMAAASRVGRLALKPRQKFELLTRHVLPGYYHLLICDLPSGNKLQLLDQKIRALVKDFYHLPKSTSNGLLYCKKIDGGLGLPKLEDMVRAANLKAFLKQIDLDDLVFNELYKAAHESVCHKTAESMGLEWPVLPSAIDNWKTTRKRKEHEEWAKQAAQGKGVQCFRGNKIGNTWLNKQELFPGEEIDLLKMRSNVFPTKATMSRADKDLTNLLCRRCNNKTETLGHVIGECPANRGARIKRHDAVVDIIQKRAEEAKWIYAREQLFDTTNEPLRPDLVIKTPGRAWVVDVSIRFEQGDSLREASREKSNKYEAIRMSVCETFGVEEFMVMPVIIGARGGFPKETQRNLALLGISSEKELTQVMRDVLRSTISIGRSHLDLG